MDNGAGNGVRTRDPELGKLVLYQLSYTRFIGLRVTVEEPESKQKASRKQADNKPKTADRKGVASPILNEDLRLIELLLASSLVI